MKRGILKMIHKKCRNSIYPSSNVKRFTVPDEKVLWNTSFSEYCPVEYTSKVLQGKPWADPNIEDSNFQPKWNTVDITGKINRVSFVTLYSIDKNNCPLNPIGRTGIKGRGILGRWGPNHAADPIVTRWKRNKDKCVQMDKITNKPILQFVSIQRRDSGEWALPGGMVDPGEKVTATLLREFMEEAMNSLEKNQSELENAKQCMERFFERGEEIYKGYVDDPRNTDNAWMETIAFNFHDDSGDTFGNLSLEAGDDAKSVRWTDISDELILYANHKDFLLKSAEKHNAHW
ncbi:PREDICTED: ADP-ribose pyrophosphatase, mitochondrial [Ceratosolen solmsi marchali]|uniref:ADP-ribose pyrophosphatase, mitochondrial n=1 Tax=Ceratosolen solmsi marchali TaxID=326594 RepID=A0AAJ7E322_9HYME|nr:PREDICTED: ADP-ribose pyrophosphatase, mitochondrial [Ceratosolen solmsi marchali]